MKIIAHRGNAAEFRENSIEAIRSALDLGCQFVEFDVRLSRDGVPVLVHDRDLKRIFNKHGAVTDFSAAELSGLHVVRLADAMKLVRSYGATAFIDLKLHGEAAVDAVLPYISGHVLVSFHISTLLYARQKGCVAIAWIVHGACEKVRSQYERELPEYLFILHDRVNEPLWPAQWATYGGGDPERLRSLGVSYFETTDPRKFLGRT